MEQITTKRLILRRWELSDSTDLYEYAKSNLVGPNAGWKPHKSEAESQSIIEMFIKQNDTYAIVLKEENKVIGSIGLHKRRHDKKFDHFVQREIGYVLNPKYWGKGYMTEAVQALMEYSFNKLNIELIWCAHFDFNERSKGVIEKCGFKYRLTQKENLPLLGNKQVTTLFYYKVNPSIANKFLKYEIRGMKF